MTYLNPILTLVFLAIFLARILYFIQLKEYRYDRFSDLLRFEKGILKIIPWPILFFYILLSINLYYQNEVLETASLTYGILAFLGLGLQSGFFRYQRTTKAHLIYALSLLIGLGLIYLNLSLALFVTPFAMFGIVLAFIPLTILAKNRRIQQAHQRRLQYTNLKVIGITGSFGKSSTKELLYHLVKDKFKTLKTPKNINTDIGVASHLLRNLKDEHEVYIVEMGAYRPGEIKKICDMVEPELGIITAIANQHYSLFKSLENIKNTKAELVRSLPEKSLAILNFDFESCQEIAVTLNYPVFSYSKADINLNNFTLEGVNYHTNLEASFLIPNLLAASKAALYLGLSPQELQAAIDTIPSSILPIQIKAKQNCVLVDDSYNSNPHGFSKAIDLVKQQKTKGRKILITMGMAELGDLSQAEHQKIANQADQVFNEIILTKEHLFSIFKKEVKKAKLTLQSDPTELLPYLQESLSPEDIVLVENRLNPLVYNYLNQD